MAEAQAPNTPVTPAKPATMNVGGTTLGVASGGGSAAVVAFFWNWIAVRDWGAPRMEISDAIALAAMLAPIVSWGLGWLPMPPVRNRRA